MAAVVLLLAPAVASEHLLEEVELRADAGEKGEGEDEDEDVQKGRCLFRFLHRVFLADYRDKGFWA